jgi:cytochrome c peroxidase
VTQLRTQALGSAAADKWTESESESESGACQSQSIRRYLLNNGRVNTLQQQRSLPQFKIDEKRNHRSDFIEYLETKGNMRCFIYGPG